MTGTAWVTNLWPYSLQVGLLVAAMGTALALLRVPSARVRLAAWRIVLATALLLPLQPWRAAQPDAIDAAAAAQRSGAQASRTPQTAAGAGAIGTEHAAEAASASSAGSLWASLASAASTVATAVTTAATAWAPAIALTLIAGVVCRLAWLALGWHRLRRHLHLRDGAGAAGSLASREVMAWQAQLQQTLGTTAHIEWRNDLAQPITFGIRPPVVLLPTRLAAMPREMQQAVICHELLHVQRRDWLWLVGEEIVRAAFWFHPAVWWLLDQLQGAREELVDRLTLRATGRRRPYLDALLTFAAEPAEPIRGAAAAFFRSRQLARRITSLMREVHMSRTQRIATALGLGLSLAGALAAGIKAFPLYGSVDTPAHAVADAPRPTAPARTPSVAPGAPEQPARRVGDGDVEAPRKVHHVAPIYPPEAREARVTGIVVIEADIDVYGHVTQARVVRGVPMLNDAAVDAVRQWRYEPTFVDGAAVPVVMTTTIQFRLP